MNVLITNVGRRGYLTRYIKEIPWFSGRVYVSDCDSTASGLYGENDGHFILPKPVDDEALYVRSLIQLCHQQSIQLVIPVIDPEIFILSKHTEAFRKEGITVLVSDERVLNICYDKLNMNAFLDSIGLCCPKTVTSLDDMNAKLKDGTFRFPLIMKPILGSGSVDTYVIHSEEEAAALFHEGLMIQDRIDGQEYGVDVLNSLGREPVACVIKKKISMRSGETDKALTVKDSNLTDLAIHLARELKHVGNLDFDVIKKGDIYYVIDLNPRFGGGYPATHAAGGGYLEKILKMLSGEVVSPDFETYHENLLVMKTVDTVVTQL